MITAVLLAGLSAGTVHLKVPLVVLDDPYCGPAAVAMLMGFHGYDVALEEIESRTYTPGLKGTLTVAITAYLREKGIAYKATRPGRIADLQDALERGHPVLALLDHGIGIYQAPHYLVVVGLDGDGLLVNSGRRAAQPIGRDAFDRRWKRAGGWMLVLE